MWTSHCLVYFLSPDRIAEPIEMANTMTPNKGKVKTVANLDSPIVDIDSPQNINAFIGIFGGSPVPEGKESQFKLPAPVAKKRQHTEHTEHTEPVGLPSFLFPTPSCPWRRHHIENTEHPTFGRRKLCQRTLQILTLHNLLLHPLVSSHLPPLQSLQQFRPRI
jgi:hypothetical protein